MDLSHMTSGYGVNVGSLRTPEGVDLPLVLPLSAGGFIIEYSQAKTFEAYQFIQKLTLSYISTLSEKLITLHIFDFSLKNPFKELAQLKDTGIYTVYSEKKAIKAYEELEELIRYRHYELLTGFDGMHDYNQNSPQKEKFHLVLWNIENIVNELSSIKDLKAFIEAGREAGIYIIAYGQSEKLLSLSKSDRKDVVAAAKIISSSYSTVKISDDSTKLMPMDDQTLKLKTLIKRFRLKHIVSTDSDALFKQANDIKEKLLFESGDSSEDFMRIPVGTTLDGRTEIYFSLGDRSSVYHAFIAGTNGTGKTTLINNIILGIAEKYTSKQVRLYLMDYKQGVEFQVFENHPNCERLFLDNTNVNAAIELVDEFSDLIKFRSELFKQSSVSNIDNYNAKNTDNPIPRTLLIIDEVQRLFSGGYKEQSHFEQQLEYVVRQGRSFGIHIIMSTQTLTGANISPAIMSQIPLRIAFKLVGSEIWKIYASNNDAPARLGKYQFIYNSEAGERSGNIVSRAFPPRDVVSVLTSATNSRSSDEITTPCVMNKGEDLSLSNNASEKKPEFSSLNIENFKSFDLTEYKEMLEKLNAGEGAATPNE